MDGAVFDWVEDAVRAIAKLRPPGVRVVFVSGNFNIVHPGHLRLLKFAAECGDLLVVGVFSDSVCTSHVRQELRLEGVRSISVVDYAFLLPETPEGIISRLRPHVVVKGKEHATGFNPEQTAVESYGGKLLFCSGETGISSLDLLRKEFFDSNASTISMPLDYLKRHQFSLDGLAGIVGQFSRLTVAVIGDLIIDEYVTCTALGMSQEDPTLVVTPTAQDRFVGGAAIVAAHASGFGAHVKYFSVVGTDPAAVYAADMLEKYQVDACLLEDSSRPTTLKQRYRVSDKTLLRVSHLRQHDISKELADALCSRILVELDSVDLVVFSDFNYGVLQQSLVDAVCEACSRRGIMMAADSQASSQISDLSRFRGMCLLTPTEREARLAVRDTRSGLVVLADSLLKKAGASHVLMTLGADGVLIHTPNDRDGFITDRLPAFNNLPRDVSGAGDSLLTCTAMALAVGSDIWQSAYLGALAAACQVARIGNTPLRAEQIIAELRR